VSRRSGVVAVACAASVLLHAGQPAAMARTAGAAAGPVAPVTLTVDDMAAPIGLDIADVFFGWQLGGSGRGTVETGYRIIVGTDDPARHASGSVVWDSGRVLSSDQSAVPYRGRRLRADSAYWWEVQVWDGAGRRSPLS